MKYDTIELAVIQWMLLIGTNSNVKKLKCFVFFLGYRNHRYDHFFDHYHDCNTNFFNHYTITYFEYFLFTWHTKMWLPSHKSTLLIITTAIKVVNITIIIIIKYYLIITVAPILVGATVTLWRIVLEKDLTMRSS